MTLIFIDCSSGIVLVLRFHQSQDIDKVNVRMNYKKSQFLDFDHKKSQFLAHD